MKTKNFYLLLVLLFGVITMSYAQTAGTMTLTYNQPQPTSPPLNKGVKNVYAVWLESATGTFVKTKARYTSTSTDDHLPTWASKSGCSSATVATGSACNVTDASTGATRTTSTTPTAYGTKTVTWDGKNVVGTTNGTVVADGSYKVCIESSWNDGADNIHNELICFTFTKGPNQQHLTPTGDTYINSVVLDWVPSSLSVEEVINMAPDVIIYPNPSTSFFNLDLKNDVKNIKVINLLGQIVYNEDVSGSTLNTTKTLNLSNLLAGSYIISLTNENGTSNFEVVLTK